jgi:hypothetical protein
LVILTIEVCLHVFVFYQVTWNEGDDPEASAAVNEIPASTGDAPGPAMQAVIAAFAAAHEQDRKRHRTD